MSDFLVEVSDLRFRHDPQRQLLEHVSFYLRVGERVALRGGNGSGKSSLMQLLLGLHSGWQGRIRIFGDLCVAEGDFARIRGRVGLLFQNADDQLFCPTVEEDVAFGPLNQRKPMAEASRIVEEVLESLDIRHLQTRPIHHLSGGERRLVALAGVLAMRPDVLLLDEPSAGLDDAAQACVLRHLHALPQAMLVASHDEAFLRQVTDRTLTLCGGVVKEAAFLEESRSGAGPAFVPRSLETT